MTITKRNVLWIGILIVIITAYFTYPLISPLFIDKEVSEAPLIDTSVGGPMQSDQGVETVANLLTGNFTGFDRIHTGTGTVQVFMHKDSHVIRFEPDFSVQNGPDLYVGFGKDGEYIKGSEIAALKGNVGSQNYVVEGGFNTMKYNEVWIWCKRFSTPFARAVLRTMEFDLNH